MAGRVADRAVAGNTTVLPMNSASASTTPGTIRRRPALSPVASSVADARGIMSTSTSPMSMAANGTSSSSGVASSAESASQPQPVSAPGAAMRALDCAADAHGREHDEHHQHERADGAGLAGQAQPGDDGAEHGDARERRDVVRLCRRVRGRRGGAT
jgi:hypothetical protein